MIIYKILTANTEILISSSQGWKLKKFPGRVKFFQAGQIFIFSQENVNIKELLSVTSLFKLLSYPPVFLAPFLKVFITAPGGSNPGNFYSMILFAYLDTFIPLLIDLNCSEI